METREAGYYFVLHSEGWEPAYFYNINGVRAWRVIGSEMELHDEDWYAIDERRIERSEVSQ